MTENAPIRVTDATLAPVAEKVAAGERLNARDGMRLAESMDIMTIGSLAHLVRTRRHGRTAFYIRNQHLNYTNVCQNHCRFCAYARREGDADAFTLNMDQVRERLMAHADVPIREIHIVGGVNPKLTLDYYVTLLNTVRSVRPDAVIKAFTPVEIDFLATSQQLSVEAVIQTLRTAGLGMMPGGGAEILNQRVHDDLFPDKIDSRRWLAIMEAVHQAGISSNATMLYGHIESPDERIDHLLSIRHLQDTTQGFTAFIPLSFHPANTQLADLPGPTAVDDLKAVAIARLMLDNVPHIKAYWVMLGEPLAQIALSFGADDMDGTIIEEKITHTAGATSAKGLTVSHMRHLIEAAGFEAVERDSHYRPISPPEAP